MVQFFFLQIFSGSSTSVTLVTQDHFYSISMQLRTMTYHTFDKLPGKFDKAYRRSRDAISFFIITGWLSRLRCVSGGDVEEVRIDVT